MHNACSGSDTTGRGRERERATLPDLRDLLGPFPRLVYFYLRTVSSSILGRRSQTGTGTTSYWWWMVFFFSPFPFLQPDTQQGGIT